MPFRLFQPNEIREVCQDLLLVCVLCIFSAINTLNNLPSEDKSTPQTNDLREESRFYIKMCAFLILVAGVGFLNADEQEHEEAQGLGL